MVILFWNLSERKSELIISHEINLNKQHLSFYLKDGDNSFRSIKRLKVWLKSHNKEMVFAMNGGMYLKNGTPQGLYIEGGKEIARLDTVQEAYGNFYMQPNGIFAITKDNKPVICKTSVFLNKDIEFATQSGPMLVIDGELHPKFNQSSKSTYVRNGVGLLPNGNLLFAISKKKVNFFTFASFFKNKGCNNALYLDGFVSRMYLPEKNWKQLDGNFGVIIAEIK
jgi:uncharacterized protein YigE (DUF2233 family)